MYKGKVMSKRDLLQKGELTICPTGSDEKEPTSWIQVKYQSFYQGGKYAGAVFIPEAGTEITYDKCENDPNDGWYLVGCVMKPSRDKVQIGQSVPADKNPKLGALNAYPHDSEDGKYMNQSMSYGVRTPLGHQLIMVEGRDPKSDIKAIRMRSGEDRGVTLDDSSEAKRVNVHSASQSANVVLTDNRVSDIEERMLGPESAQLHAKRNVLVDASEGELTLKIKDGLNIVISNPSTGSHAPISGFGLGFGDPEYLLGQSGNVIIESDRGDISIRNHGNGVFIDCMGSEQENGGTGASFQVRSNNKIHLYAQNGIDIKSTGDLNMIGANVNIKAFDYVTNTPGTINLNSTTIDPNSFMSIRKTNAEIDMEMINPATVLRYFDSGNGWDANYKPGYNPQTQARNPDPNL